MCIFDNYAQALAFWDCIPNPQNPKLSKNPISERDCGEANPKTPKNPISEEECRTCASSTKFKQSLLKEKHLHRGL